MNKEPELTGSIKSKRKVPWLLLTTTVAAATLITLITTADRPSRAAHDADIVVYKTATCSCCGKWVAHLRDAGLDIAVVNVDSTRSIQERVGVPRNLRACHTAVVGDYWVEGHVPADLVRRLMTEKPEGIQGIAVPGMPAGSPGMESPRPMIYEVLAYGSDGNITGYATRRGLTEDQRRSSLD